MKTRIIFSLFLFFFVGFFIQVKAGKILEEKTTKDSNSEKELALTVNIIGKLNLCSIEEKGYVFLDIKGGNPPYSVSWKNQEGGPFLYDLNPGSYTVLIKDNSGNQVTEKFMIQPPIPVKVDVNEVNHANVDSGILGSASLNIKSYGNRTFKIEWCNGLKDTLEAKNLTPGTYTVKVFDEFGCDSTIAFEIKNQEIFGSDAVNQNPIGSFSTSATPNLNQQDKISNSRNYSKMELMKIAEEIQSNRALASKK